MIEVNSAIEQVFNMLKSKEDIAYDVETDGLKWQRRWLSDTVSQTENRPLRTVRHESGGNIEGVEAFERGLQQAIQNREANLITHNGKFDSHQSLNHKVEIGNKIKDTMIGAALLDENARSYSLESTAAKFPDIPQKTWEQNYTNI